MPSAPSIPPDACAARSLAAPRVQGSGASQQNDTQTFAALLQIAPPAPLPVPNNGPAGSPPQLGPQNPPATHSPAQNAGVNAADAAHPNSNTADGRSSGEPANSGKGGSTASTASDSQNNASGTATSASTSAASNADPGTASTDATSGAATQSGSAAGNDASQAAAASSAETMALANANTDASPSPTKNADKSDSKSASGKGDTTPNSSQTQPLPSSMQPVAAALVVSTPSDAAPSAPTTGAIVDGQAPSRGKTSALPAGSQKALTQDPKNAATADANAASQTNSQDQSGGGTADSGAAGSPAGAPASAGAQQNQASPGPPSQSQAQVDANASAAQPQATVQGADPTKARADIFGLTSTSGAGGPAAMRPGTNAANPNALPNFGLVAANATANAAGNATLSAATASSAAVPVAGLAVAIAARAQGGSNQFDIRLDPPELGRIDVRLAVDRSGQVTSHVTVDRPDTLQLLQSQQSQLQRALEQAGLKTADNGLQFTLRDQSFTGQNGNGGNRHGGSQNSPARLVIADGQASLLDARPIYTRWSRASGLDISV